MIEDLLRRFVAQPWVEQLDFPTLEQVPAHWVSEHLEQRESDLVWRVRYRPQREWFYVYILIELQSTVERFMAIRFLAYLCLFYQWMIESGQVPASGRLPPVLPVVLYNGDDRWWAEREVSELVQPVPEGLERFVPRFEYLVLDEGHYPADQLRQLADHSPVAALLQLEQSRGLTELPPIVEQLDVMLHGPELRELRRDFTIWLRQVALAARFDGEEIPDLRDLGELKDMIEQRVREWPRQWRAEGFQAGLREGHESGLREGQAQMLLRLAERRFGPSDPRLRARIEAAGPDQIAAWAERLLTASSLEDIFSD
jgi:predicted transposase YdaD